jgi:uroporphyrinogen-III decarboxylase
MTNRERMLKAMRGERADRLVWAPRLDVWYNAHKYQNTLAPTFEREVGIDEVADTIGGAYHKVVPDYIGHLMPDTFLDRGLSIWRAPEVVYDVEFVGTDREVKKEDDGLTRVTYHTPVGKVSCTFGFTDEMKRGGASVPWIREPVIKSTEDYRVVGYIFRSMKVVPNYGPFIKIDAEIGDKSVPVTFANDAASPMHLIMKHFMEPTRFYLELYDHPAELRGLSEDMAPFFDEVFRVIADSPAEVIFFGANFDETITPRPFFKEHILPWIQKGAGIFHEKGKLLLCHCDGENKGILHLLAETGMDVAEAVCPQPMTKVTIREVKEAFRGKITIFGGIPSVALLPESMGDSEFDKFMNQLFSEIAPGDRFILGVSDTTPPDASLDRLRQISRMVEERGALPMEGH